MLSAKAPAGGTCRSRPCWSLAKGGVKYQDREATPDGLISGQLLAGEAGKANITLKGKGANLHLPELPLIGPVKVRVVRSGGPACFEASFFSPSKNDRQRYKALN